MFHSNNIARFNQSLIRYDFVYSNNINNVLLNYIGQKEITFLLNNSIFNHQIKYIVIHMIYTEKDYRNNGCASSSLAYFIETMPKYPIFLFCENYYSDFDLVYWYKKLGFKDIYYNSEATLLILDNVASL